MIEVTARQQLSDDELIIGYKNGNYSDFETLLARHQSKVYGYIFMSVKNKDIADDIFQDTFFKVIHTINSVHTKMKINLSIGLCVSHTTSL